jgi:hypothetical protein
MAKEGEGTFSKINKASMGADIAGIAHGLGYGTAGIHPWVLGWSLASLGGGLIIDKWLNKNKQGQESTFTDKLGTVGWFGVGGMVAAGILRNGAVFQIAALTTAAGLGGKWILERGKEKNTQSYAYSETPSNIIPFTKAQTLRSQKSLAA